MAVPTISAISPSSGNTTGRNLVEITGTNFSTPPEDPADPSGDAFQSIKVMFGSLQSPAAYAITATRAIATVPTFTGDEIGDHGASVRLALYNLDDNGVEVPGELAFFDTYTYQRPRFTDVQVGEYVVGRFIKYLRRYVHPNVWATMGRSYTDIENQVEGWGHFPWEHPEGSDLYNVIKQAELPLIWINGFDYEDEPLAQVMGVEEVDISSTEFEEYRPGRAVSISMPSILIFSRSEHAREITALAQAIITAFNDVTHLACDPHTFDVASSGYNYPLTIPKDGMPSFNLGPSNDGLKICSMAAVIEEVNLTDLSGTLTDIGWTVEDEDSPEIILIAG